MRETGEIEINRDRVRQREVEKDMNRGIQLETSTKQGEIGTNIDLQGEMRKTGTKYEETGEREADTGQR